MQSRYDPSHPASSTDPPARSDGESSPESPYDLHFFTYEVDGQLYGGWYRLRNGAIEVFARAHMRKTRISQAQAPEGQVRMLLEDIIRESEALHARRSKRTRKTQ